MSDHVTKDANNNDEAVKYCNSCATAIPVAAIKCAECNSYQNFRRFFSTSEFFIAQLISLISVCTLLVSIVSGIKWPNYELTFNRVGHNGPYLLVVVQNMSDKKAAIIDADVRIMFKKDILRENTESFLASVPLDIVDYENPNTIVSGVSVKKMVVQGFASPSDQVKQDFLPQNVDYFFNMLFDRGSKVDEALKVNIDKARRDLIKKSIYEISKAIICAEDKNVTPIKMEVIDKLIEPNFEMGIAIRAVDANGEVQKKFIPIKIVSMEWWFANYKKFKNDQNKQLTEFQKKECKP